MTVRAQDFGDGWKYSDISIDIRVVESHKVAPSFLAFPQKPIRLQENFSDYDAIIVKLEAVSHVADNDNLLFELATGGTDQTNKGGIFRYENDDTVRF